MDITKLNHIHFTGIKGVGLTPLALCALDLGIKVTGSDTGEEFITDEVLIKRGIKWNVGFGAENLSPRPDLLVTTGAHGGLSNPEVLVAKQLQIPVLTHGEALGAFMRGKVGVSVCGVGGKTTTSSMIATILDRLGNYPSFAVGTGDIFVLGTPGRYDKRGRFFIAEADEYANSPGIDNTPKFLFQNPKFIISTNIEQDHPDIFPTVSKTKKAFLKFFNKLSSRGLLIANIDNKNTQNLLKEVKVRFQTFGFSPRASWVIEKSKFYSDEAVFDLRFGKKQIKDITLSVPGEFNVYNAAASIALVYNLGFNQQKIKEAILHFTGTRRRFERIGQLGGVLIYDDYAHHPVQIKATLKAARKNFAKRRLLVIFQPHTYSRTKAFFQDFARSFKDADIVGIMDIYSSARELDTMGVSGELLAKEIQKFNKKTTYVGNHEQTISFLKKQARKGDVVFTLGAGDIFLLHKMLKNGN